VRPLDIDLGPGTQTVDANFDGLVEKLEADQVQWAQVTGTLGWSPITGLTVDEAGFAYAVYVLVRDPDPWAYVLRKLDPQTGAEVWSRTLQGPDNANTIIHGPGPRLARGPGGELVLAGQFTGTVDLDPDPTVEDLRTAEGDTDVFILRLDESGDTIGVTTSAGAGTAEVSGLAISPSGEIHIVGTYQGPLVFPDVGDAALDSSSCSEAFWVRL